MVKPIRSSTVFFCLYTDIHHLLTYELYSNSKKEVIFSMTKEYFDNHISKERKEQSIRDAVTFVQTGNLPIWYVFWDKDHEDTRYIQPTTIIDRILLFENDDLIDALLALDNPNQYKNINKINGTMQKIKKYRGQRNLPTSTILTTSDAISAIEKIISNLEEKEVKEINKRRRKNYK